MFLHTQKPLLWQEWGGLQNLRGECNNRCSEGKTENPPQRSFPTSTSHLRSSLHTCPATGVCVLRLKLRRSDSREKTGVDCCEDSLRGLVHTAKGIQGRETGAARVARDQCQGTLYLQGPSNCVLPDCRTSPSQGGMSWLQPLTPEVDIPLDLLLPRLTWAAEVRGQWTWGLWAQRWPWGPPRRLPSCEQVTTHTLLGA